MHSTGRARPVWRWQTKIFFITLAVDDLDRSVAFYRDGLGWPTEGLGRWPLPGRAEGPEGNEFDVN